METVFIALRVALSLGVVLGLLWVLQRRLSSTGRAKRTAGVVNVVTRQGISPKASVVVVDVDGTRFLLGVTDSSVTMLHSADAPAEEPALAAVAPLSVAGTDAAGTDAAGTDAAGTHDTSTHETSAGVFARTLSAAAGSPTVGPFDDDAAYRRPRNRARNRKPSGALEGSVLSAATWRQAGTALRQGRAG